MPKKFQKSPNLKRINRVLIFGNGALHRSFIQNIKKADYLIGVDKAAFWLIKHNIIPDIAIGDFDSCNPKEISLITQKIPKIQSYLPQKDKTDMELAADYAVSINPKNSKTIVIYGGIGSRVDHVFGTIEILRRFHQKKIKAQIIDENNILELIKGKMTVEKNPRFPYISILPYTQTIKVSLTGFKYPAKSLVIKRGETRGISNQIISKTASLNIEKGIAYVIFSKD